MTEALKRSDHVVTRKIGEELVLVPVSGERGDLEVIFRLDQVGAFIWERLAEETTSEELTASIVENFDVTAERAGQDLAAFLADLKEAHLLAAAEVDA